VTSSWGADPTGLGQPAGFQVAAGQLGQGSSLALAATPGVGGVGRAGQRLQGRAEHLAGFGFQPPLHRDHAGNGGGQPQPLAGMAACSVPIGALRVGHLEQVA
jgi:hypothetical protein